MAAKTGRCTPSEHAASRRQFLGASAASGLTAFAAGSGALANEVSNRGKRVILLWLAGGASQFETFDPKPDRGTVLRQHDVVFTSAAATGMSAAGSEIRKPPATFK